MKYTTELPKASFENGIAVTAGWEIVYPANPVTGEYVGVPTMDYFMVGTTPAAFAYLDAPKLKEGFAVIRGDGWELVEDHRGEVYWIKATRERVVIQSPGALSDEFTEVEPKPGQIWKDGWVMDEDYVKSQLAELKLKIQDDILWKTKTLRTKASLGTATEEDKATLQTLSDYIDAVNTVEVVNGAYTLPEQPAFLSEAE